MSSESVSEIRLIVTPLKGTAKYKLGWFFGPELSHWALVVRERVYEVTTRIDDAGQPRYGNYESDKLEWFAEKARENRKIKKDLLVGHTTVSDDTARRCADKIWSQFKYYQVSERNCQRFARYLAQGVSISKPEAAALLGGRRPSYKSIPARGHAWLMFLGAKSFQPATLLGFICGALCLACCWSVPKAMRLRKERRLKKELRQEAFGL